MGVLLWRLNWISAEERVLSRISKLRAAAPLRCASCAQPKTAAIVSHAETIPCAMHLVARDSANILEPCPSDYCNPLIKQEK